MNRRETSDFDDVIQCGEVPDVRDILKHQRSVNDLTETKGLKLHLVANHAAGTMLSCEEDVSELLHFDDRQRHTFMNRFKVGAVRTT
jgi:hypothetical protein